MPKMTQNTPPWSGARLAEIVAAIERGQISTEEARDRYGLGPEQIAAWQRTLNSLGRRPTRKRTAPAATGPADR